MNKKVRNLCICGAVFGIVAYYFINKKVKCNSYQTEEAKSGDILSEIDPAKRKYIKLDFFKKEENN